MSFWRQFTRGLRALTRRAETDQEAADEVQHYLEQAIAEHQARGLSAVAAERAARLELGSVTSVREQMRGYGWENIVEALFTDLRFALRRLRSEPGFSILCIVTLALGIGGTTAIFSAVRPILFQPLPYPDAERIAQIWEVDNDGARSDGTYGMTRQLAQRARSFSAISAMRGWQPTLIGAAAPERLEGQRVSASYFDVLGVTPALGRAFHESDDQLNGPNVVLLSDGLWRRRFAGDRGIVGRQIMLDEQGFTVIGVLPPAFENVVASSAELWAPLQYDMSQGRAWGHHLRMLGRLRPGVSSAQAVQELNAIGRAVLAEQDPETYGDQIRFSAPLLRDDVVRAVKPALLAIIGAVLLVLAIACVNVTNLLLARDARRRSEFALRAALGAGHGRLIRQTLTESLFLAALGGLAGVGVALLGVRALIALSPPDLPRINAIAVNGSTLVFAMGVTTLIGLAFGLLPALRAAYNDPQRALQAGSRRTAGQHQRTRNALVVAQVSVALVLLVSSGLLLRSLQRLFAIESGFKPEQLLTLQVHAAGQRFNADSTTYDFFARVLEAVRRVPGVGSAALTSQLPLSGDYELFGLHFEPRPVQDQGEVKGTFRYAVSPGYFQTMGIPLRRGRFLDERDQAQAPRVALVSESLARRRLPGLDPIGQHVRIGNGPLYTVVGIVGDVKQQSLAASEAEAVYVTAAQWRFADRSMSLVVRSRTDAAALSGDIRRAVWSVDKDQPIVRVATMNELLASTAAQRRFAFLIFQVFALTALLLAGAGIFGVISGSVAERTREIGVRAALGATRKNILRMVLGQGLTLTALGAAIGAIGAAAASQALVTLLFNVSPLDALTYLSVVALLLAVALLACLLPALRALRIDPAITLRVD